ncbi:hypothetical protein C8J56DRAFT_1170147 [Mycena floridula]|nr:hypothetical protein C8J56DRAFT_1170147 [Mycena floridula]
MRTGRNVLSTWDSRLLASGRKLAIFLDSSRSPSLVVAGLLEEIKGLDEEWLSGIQSLCKERAWSSKQAAVMVFEEAATRIKILTIPSSICDCHVLHIS